MTPTMDDWAAFLGKTKTAVKAKRMQGSDPVEWTSPEFEWIDANEVTISDTMSDPTCWRPTWAWSLMQTKETGTRRCWMSGRMLSDGECMIHIEGRWGRGVHISQLTPEAWHFILGQPRGGDGRIMGQLRSKWTREAKRAMEARNATEEGSRT